MAAKHGHTVWRLDGTIARAEGAIDAEVDLLRPHEGLIVRRVGVMTLPARWCCLRFLQTEWPLPRTGAAGRCDAFIRGNDLIAAYPPDAEFPFQVAVLHRWIAAATETGDGLGLETIVSVNTPLLDSRPTLEMASRWPQGDVLQLAWAGAAEPAEAPRLGAPTGPLALNARLLADKSLIACTAADGPGCWIVRPAGYAISFVEMLYPSDFEQTHVDGLGSDGCALRHCFFTRPLEKGVILRCRRRVLMASRPNDAAAAASLWNAFAAESPFLSVY